MISSRRTLLAACLLAAPPLLQAQSIWISPLTSKGDVDLEWSRPSFESNAGLGTFRGIWVGTGRYRVGARGAIVVAVPRLVGGGFESFGNPYVGYQAAEQDGNSVLSLGLRVPNVTSGFGSDQLIAFRGDFDRYEEMAPKLLTIRAEGQGRVWHDSAGADVQVRGGFTLLHPIDHTYSNENDLLFDYGVRFGHRWPRLELGAGLTGRFLMTGTGGGFTDRNADQAAVDLAWHGRVVPRVAFRIPVTENLKDAYKTAFIFGLEVPLR